MSNSVRTYFGGKYILGHNADFYLRSRKTYHLRIFDAWDFLNLAAFDGEMIRPKLTVWERLYCKEKGKRVRLAGCYIPHTSEIFLWWKGTSPLQTMYHEMVHQYIFEVLLRDDIGHGPLFREIYYDGYEKITKYLKRKAL